jgi:hypothetical protein
MAEVEDYHSESDINEQNDNKIISAIENGDINVENVEAYLNIYNISPTVINAIVNKKLWNKTTDRQKYDKEYNTKYYQKQKESNKPVICDICQGKYTKYNMVKHQTTKRHLLMKNQKENII